MLVPRNASVNPRTLKFSEFYKEQVTVVTMVPNGGLKSVFVSKSKGDCISEVTDCS